MEEKPKEDFPGAVPADAKLVGLLRQFIRPTNDDATVDRVLAEVKTHIKDNADLTKQAADGWTRVLHFGDRYGTPYARKVGQEFLDQIEDAMSFGNARILPLLLVSVSTVAAAEHISFPTRILPMLTKAGCNAGACHGAAVGAGGLKLSLLGYDPVQDHANLTRELGGRRLDQESPAQSLFLRKALGELDHEGGRRIKRDSETQRTLLDVDRRWRAIRPTGVARHENRSHTSRHAPDRSRRTRCNCALPRT